MKYVVKKGYSYTDIHGREKIYGPGEEFNGELDPTQKWKLGVVQAEPELEVTTKHATQTQETETKAEEIDPMDEGEETE